MHLKFLKFVIFYKLRKTQVVNFCLYISVLFLITAFINLLHTRPYIVAFTISNLVPISLHFLLSRARRELAADTYLASTFRGAALVVGGGDISQSQRTARLRYSPAAAHISFTVTAAAAAAGSHAVHTTDSFFIGLISHISAPVYCDFVPWYSVMLNLFV